jgi:antirestriction protein ArdC
VDDYYATALHELTHWTGHSSRNAREYGKRFGDQAYAREELVAEMGAAFLCAKTGITAQLQHASYIGSWLKVLKGDKRAVLVAAGAAQRAADFVTGWKAEEKEEAAAA